MGKQIGPESNSRGNQGKNEIIGNSQFTSEEAAKLRRLGDRMSQREPELSEKRLRFARWLFENGKLNEG